MRATRQSVRQRPREESRHRFPAVAALVLTSALTSAAQMSGGPPTTTTVGGHFLAPPPSATSTAARHTPNAAPSVTSIPNFGHQNGHGAYYNGHYSGGHRNGGWAYAVPYYYYYPADNSAYGYDYVGGGDGGPDLYSGPPLGPNDQAMHMLAEQPPVRVYGDDPPEYQAYATPAPRPSAPPVEIKPGDPTVLVFSNGKRQEVTNYAIMGDTLYVFDEGRKKIALTDLNIPATVKANEDRGMEFKVPASQTKPKNSAIPSTSAPEEPTAAPNSVPSALP